MIRLGLTLCSISDGKLCMKRRHFNCRVVHIAYQSQLNDTVACVAMIQNGTIFI